MKKARYSYNQRTKDESPWQGSSKNVSPSVRFNRKKLSENALKKVCVCSVTFLQVFLLLLLPTRGSWVSRFLPLS